mmetsp:Transcript_47409/g.93262  ORF Transcript_47409/g.93262 Transcript_47409/m.93262 type:complete len:91 (+) Transcript_47409:268-540(+)
MGTMGSQYADPLTPPMLQRRLVSHSTRFSPTLASGHKHNAVNPGPANVQMQTDGPAVKVRSAACFTPMQPPNVTLNSFAPHTPPEQPNAV